MVNNNAEIDNTEPIIQGKVRRKHLAKIKPIIEETTTEEGMVKASFCQRLMCFRLGNNRDSKANPGKNQRIKIANINRIITLKWF